MKERYAIAATIGAVSAAVGATLGLMAAQGLGGSGVSALLTSGGGSIMAGVLGVAATLALPWRDGGGPDSDARQQLVLAVERLATGRVSDVSMELGEEWNDMVFALQQLADRFAEDRRRAQARESELRDASTQHSTVVRQLRVEVERRTEQMAAAKKVRDTFLTRMSHELRTPLNAILGYLEMIEEDVEEPQMLQDLARVRASAMSLLATVTTVLDLTQLEAGSYEVIPETIDMVAMGQQVQASVKAEADGNGNRLDVAVPANLMVRLDRRMVKSILFNLMSNACKYTTNGDVSLSMAEDDGRLSMLVRDTGIGMTPRQIEEAYRPFGQGDESATRRYDGAGLGLAVVRGFAEAMGGEVEIESKLGQGASVAVSLPLKCAPKTVGLNDDDPTMLLR
ncbi:MAG: hypothetical protein KTR31_05450 [Myxococcales bacterium]|nr:hypothetical protein [Myxococcales bacterium]